MRTRKIRTAIAIAIFAGPLCTACELVLDFDRSLLPPEYDASLPDSGGGTTDATTDRGADSPSTRPDADAGNNESDADSSSDAEAG